MRVVIIAVVLATACCNIADGRTAKPKAVDCAGVEDGTFVYDTCATFVLCYDGVAITQNCALGSYFDETEESCVPDTDGTCPQNAAECLEDGVFSENPSNCSSFYVCYEGRLVEQNCGWGSYFDTANLNCVPDVEHTCWEVECTENGAFTENPANCSSFYVCYENELVEQNCGWGSYFDAANSNCAPDADHTCWPVECTENGVFSANPTNCSMFYVCYDGKLVEQNCGTGSYFDTTNLYCIPDVDNVCWTVEATTPAPCPCPGGYVEGDFVANPDTCYLYSICSGGQLVEQNCGAGNYFNANTNACEKDENNVCWPEITTTTEAPASCACPGGYADGEFVANPDTCYLYSICSEGQLVEQNCGAGNYFNANTKACEKDVNNVCWPEVTTTTEAPASCACPGGYADGEFVPNPDTCYLYSICSEGQLVEQNCGAGNYFNANTKACEKDVNNVCWPEVTTTTEAPASCACPGGYADGEFVANPDTCYLYSICSEGQLVEQNCGAGNYFNANTKACEKDVNNVCWPEITTTTEAPASCACPGGYPDGEFVANPDTCYLYSICSEGQLVEQNCGAGNYFNANTKACEKDVNNVCWPEVTTTTEAPASCACPGGYANGEFVANPETCYLYSICSEGQLVEQNCGAGNYFNANTKACEKDVNNVCWPEITTTTEAPASCACPGGYPEGEFVANPDTCYLYSICSEGQLVEQNCGAGNYFNANTKACEKDVNNVCWPEVTTTTEAPASCACPGGYADGEFVANPDTCYLYSICSEGQLVEQNCGAGNYFNANTKACEKDENNVCWPEVTTTTEAPTSCTCPGGYADGEFVANPDTCYLYSICSEGQLVEQNCGAGNYFNANTKACEKDENNVCWPEVTTTTEAPASCACPGGYADGEFVANPDTCYLYSICSEGQLVEQNCGAGNYFNANTKACEKDVNNVCWPEVTTTTEAPASCACPGGYADGEFVANPDTCYLYSICSEGQLVEQNCGAGNYFNANTKACEKDVNNVCWPEVTTTTEAPASCACPGGYADGEFVANPDTCYLYSICSEGHLVEQNCGAGNYFNANTKACEKDVNNVCWPEITTTTMSSGSGSCPGGLAEGDLVEIESSCGGFYICFDGKLIAESCGDGNYFDRTDKTCVRDNEGSCRQSSTAASSTTIWSSSEVQSTASASMPTLPTILASSFENRYSCPEGYVDGDLLPYPGNCSMFYACMSGALIEVSCDYGNYFDNGLKSCVLDTFGICWRTSTPSPVTAAATVGETTPAAKIDVTSSCPDGYQNGDLAPYSSNCSMFYICFDGKLIEESCGFGNYFDTTSRNCVLDTLGICWQSAVNTPTTTPQTTAATFAEPNLCPEGNGDGDLAPYPNNCFMFYFCYNGEVIEQSCGFGNYFDSSSKSCILDTHGHCWQTLKPVANEAWTTTTMLTSIIPISTRYPTSIPSTEQAWTTTTMLTSIVPISTTYPTSTPQSAVEALGSTASLNGAFACPEGYGDGDLAVYSSNCSMFYICDNGQLIENACGYGNYFDSVSRSCILDTFGICWQLSTTEEATPATEASISDACPQGHHNGEIIAYPSNCYMFQFCFNGQLIEESCGYGNYFDNSSKSCVVDTLGVCWPVQRPMARSATPSAKRSSGKRSASTRAARRPCRGGELDGDFIPHPNNCSMFYVCYNGKSFEESCGFGNYFDNTTRSCIMDVLGVCWQPSTSATSTTTTIVTSTMPSTAKQSTSSTNSALACAGGFEYGEFVQYPNNCSMFFICYNGKLTEESCGYGNYFDKTSKSCHLDTLGVCWQAPATQSTPPTTQSTTRRRKSSTSAAVPSSTSKPATKAAIELSATTASTTTTLSTSTPSTSTQFNEDPYACLNGKNDGELFAYPNNCSMFYICYKGMLIVESCGYNNYFDRPARRCVFDTTQVCWQTKNSSAKQDSPSTAAASTAAFSTAATSIEVPSTVAPSTVAPSTEAPSTAQPTRSTSVASQSGNNDCSSGYADGEFIPHPRSCYQYLVCYRGLAIEMSCGLDNYFDETTKSCVPDKMGLCWPKSTSIPTTSSPATFTTDATRTCLGGYLDGELVPVPDVCYLFFVCYKGELITLSCGEGNYFDKSSKSCAPDTRRVCWNETVVDTPTTAELCSNGMREGQIASHRESCHAYHICEKGQLVEGSCGLFNYFNPSTNTCEKDHEGKCWPVQPTAQAETKIVECPNGLKEGQFTVSPSSCFLYQICSNGQLVEGNCGTFNYFNPLNNHCERDVSGECWPVQPTAQAETKIVECPNGLKEGQFIASPSSCFLYQICSNGQLVEGNCGTFNYFNPLNNHCERDVSGECWPVQPTAQAETKIVECPNGLKEGQFTASPSSCFLYQICSNGQLVEGNCGTFNYFSPLTNHCERDLSGTCWPVQPTTQAETKIVECPNGLKEGQFIASPSSCFLYQICSNGQLVEGNCGTFNYFNPLNNHCERDVSGECWPVQPTAQAETKIVECPNGLKEGQFIASPSSCFLYQICSNGQLVEGNCGTFNYFNPLNNHCERDVSGTCWPVQPTAQAEAKIVECPNGLKEGQFTASPSSCFLYQICSNGQLVEGNCGTSNYFNANTNLCEVDTNGICWPAPTTTSAQPSPTTPTPNICSNGQLNGQLSAHGSSCSAYFICAAGELVEGNCGVGNYFNNNNKICEPDTNGICWPRPETSTKAPVCPYGLLEGQFTSHATSCSRYYICSGGELVEGYCGFGNYFNKNENICERDTTGQCWPMKTTPPSRPSPPSMTTPPAKPTSKACPTGTLNGQFLANPSSCHLYHICNNGELVDGDCGSGNIFNRTTLICESDVLGICGPANAVTTRPVPPISRPCPVGVQNGQFIANPSSCQKYQICNNGQLLNGDCGAGKLFNRTALICEPDVLGICDPANAVPTSPAPPNTTPCPVGVQNGQFIANPSSCQKYQICNNGQLLNGDCGAGKLFNRTALICEPDVLGICDPANAVPTSPAPPISTPCPVGVQNGQFIANPSSCQKYQICNNGQLLNGDCGAGKLFNRTALICEPDVLGICDPANAVPTSPAPPNTTPCPVGVQNGQFIANPSSCQKYQICNNGQLLNGDCGAGKLFNRTALICEPDVLGICDPANVVLTSPAPPISTPCPVGVQNGQFIANPSSCQKYQICNNGQLLNGDCGAGKLFNRTALICEPDVLGICDPANAVPTSPAPPISTPCPVGVQNGQFIANPSSCQKYQICNNGQLLNGDCGAGKFFNKNTLICETDVFGICNPANTGPINAASCPNGVLNGQFIANPSSCHKYQICYNGQLLNGDCGAGKLFNKNTLLCEPDVLGVCNPINVNACPAGVLNGQFVPIPGECDKFWICNEGSLVVQSCGVGYYYDVDNKYCTRDVSGSCWSAQPSSDTCIGVPDGAFLPNEAACNKFFMCYNNTKISQECGVGNVFNTATLSCVRDTLGTCWKKVPNVCAGRLIGSLVPNPANCQEFYVCYANRAVLQQCGNGNYFNSTRAICEPDVNGVCINVCEGLRGNVSLPHSNCDQFYTCSDGLTTGVGTCPTGTNFDALTNICLSTAVCEANLCSNSANGVVYPVENDVNSFYSCYNNIALKLACPEGTAFDPLLSICIPDTGRCVGRKNGFTVASPNNPNAYYVCKSNMAIFEQCPSYAIFDEKKGICVQAQRRRFVKNICSGEPDGSVLPGDSCNTYHLCLDGEVVDQDCGAYSAFSAKLGYCVFNLTCFDKNEICAKASDIERFPDARRQTSFIKCKHGVAKSEKCQKHLIYSHDIGYCVPREMTMSEDELEQLCEGNPDNSMAPGLDCRKFYICRNKVAILQQCAVDQYFDVKTGSCIPDVDRKCWQRSDTLRRSFFLKSVCLEDQVRVHPDDCSRYEVCTFGMWLAKSCPRRQVFNTNSKSCIPGDVDKVCPRARSAVLLECSDEQPLRPSDEACTDYYRCADNQWKLQRCPVGEFFNPLAGTCSKDVSACARIHATPPAKDSRCISNETIPSDINCGLFYICYEGEWWYRHCAEGTYFNKTQDGCTPNDGTCRLTSEKGSCKNGTAKPSDFNPCSAYHLCVDGNWTVQYCPAGHHFDDSRKACMQDDDEGVCRSGVKMPSSPCVDADRRHQTSNCAAFDLCSFGKWYSVPCPQGFYFDISLRQCIVNRGDCSADGALRRDCIAGTSRPSQHNCTEFYFCTKGKWYVESCLKGFQYNATIDKCIQTNATCPVKAQTKWPQDKCADAAAVTSEPHESNCTMYYLCVHGLAVEAECDLGQFYDAKTKRCRLNNGSCVQPAAPTDGVCKEKANGSQVQNPFNCTSFYTCTDAAAILSHCPVGEYFNAAAGACQTDTGTCNKVELCDSSTGDSVPHEVFCNIYYSCVRGLAIPVACDAGQLFDPFAKKCTTDVRNRCVDGILVGDAVCLSGEDSQPKEDSEDCSAYIMCSQGTAQRLQCPKGQFFNASTLACVPNEGSCLKASVSTETMSCAGKHGYLMPDLEHCNGFYVCINGVLQRDRCTDGEYFDASTRKCTPMAANQTCASLAGLLSTVCATSEDDTNFADQSDCRKYFQCNNGELQSKKCRTGESFDALLGFCRQNDGTCLLENGQRVGACAGKHGKLAVDAENCHGYFTCINGQKISQDCAPGEVFDKTTRTCRKDLDNTCQWPEEELANQTQLSCSGLTELVFYPNVIDGCRTFYQCVKGTPRIHKCPDDLLFNGVTGTCDWKDYVKCIDMTDHHHGDELCVNAKNGTRYGSTLDNCDSYFVCTNGKLNSFRCDNGLKFNTSLDKCDAAANVNCTTAPPI